MVTHSGALAALAVTPFAAFVLASFARFLALFARLLALLLLLRA